jgi:signal transduction histidine kinase
MGEELARLERDDATAGGQDAVYPHVVLARQAFEFGTEPQFRTDGHGVILEANHAAAHLLRCNKEFLIGKPLGLFLAEGQRGRFYAALSRFWQGAASVAFETQVTRRGSEPRDVEVRGVADPHKHSEGRGGVRFHWQFSDVTERNRAEAARDDLLRRIVTAQEDERRRVSRELHDSVGQLVTALKLAVSAAREECPPAAGRLGEVQQLADELARTVHDLAVQLRPTALDDLGLNAALNQLLAGWSARTGVEVDFVCAREGAERLPAEVETTIYRLVQEALTNVTRHARAGRVGVVIGRHGGQATLAVEDDGVGFDPEAAAESGRLGLIGMRERAALVGGSVEVESAPGRGTTILARFPVPERGKP